MKLHSFKALKRYLNDVNLTHDRKTATILKFTAQNLQSHYSFKAAQFEVANL